MGLASCPSVRLFVDRAQAVRPDFQVTQRNAAAVAALCRRLEGLPLAIELAAARIQVLNPAQMLVRLEERFELLVGRQRDAASRHRSLRAALAWSYQLLSPELQAFFRQLSVFRGGWTLDAAVAVCEQPRGLDYLEELRGCSLVLVEEGISEVRFRLLETLREFGAEHLAPAERETLARRHVLYFLRFAEEAEQARRGSQERVWMDRLAQEMDNLRAALDWAQSEEEAELGLRLGTALGYFWDVRGCIAEEEQQRVASLLSLPGTGGSAIRARALAVAQRLAVRRGDLATARRFAEECFAIWEALGDRTRMAHAVKTLGCLAHMGGDYPTACSLVAKSLAIFRELGDRRGIAAASNDLGFIFRSAEAYEAAIPLLEESLAIDRDLGDRGSIATQLTNLGNLARCRGNYEKARMLLEEALATGRELDNIQIIVHTNVCLAMVALKQGDLESAAALCQESLSLWREMGSLPGVAFCMDILAVLARAQGRLQRAVWLSGQASALREGTRPVWHEPDFRADYAHHL
jgi:tetratricopeptide (TPR) repeat protein